MEALLIKKKITASKKNVVDLHQLSEGDEIELLIMVKPFTKLTKSKNRIFDMVQWANKWETDLGENIQSSNVESFTGKRF